MQVTPKKSNDFYFFGRMTLARARTKEVWKQATLAQGLPAVLSGSYDFACGFYDQMQIDQ